FCASDRVLNRHATSSQTSRRTPSPASSLSTMRVRHFTVRIPTLHRQALLLAHDGTFGLLKADERPNLASEQDRIRYQSAVGSTPGRSRYGEGENVREEQRHEAHRHH